MDLTEDKKGRCPLCKGEITDDMQRYVESELYRKMMNPDYEMRSWSKRER